MEVRHGREEQPLALLWMSKGLRGRMRLMGLVVLVLTVVVVVVLVVVVLLLLLPPLGASQANVDL
jgi:hypothetical protein